MTVDKYMEVNVLHSDIHRDKITKYKDTPEKLRQHRIIAPKNGTQFQTFGKRQCIS